MTWAAWRKIKQEYRDPLGQYKHRLYGTRSNKAKHKILYNLFKSLVEWLRVTTGKSRGKKLFWLPSSITRIAPNVNPSSVLYQTYLRRSLYGKYLQMLDGLYVLGKIKNEFPEMFICVHD